MEYVNFGTAGVKVSRVALGLGLRGQGDEKAAERLILKALDGGITLFDCANVYGLRDDRAYAGRSELVLGRALKSHRDDVVITSKVCSPVGTGNNDQGCSRYHILREVERSLRRLDTDRIDVYLLHQFDPLTPLEEQFRALDDLVRQGKVRYVGVCNYQAWQVCRALWVQDRLNAGPLITVQNPYNLLNRSLESEMFPLVRTLGLGIMAYAPLGTGLLSGAYRVGEAPPPSTLWGTGRRREQFARAVSGRAAEVVSTVQDVSQRSGATVAQIALKWVLSHSEITVAISGADTEAQIDENLRAVDVQIDPDDLTRLDQASQGLGMFLDGPQFV
ncbi:MAG TPA: aldo/keto reductase [Chloroflexota bacterium]|nr:aldo/keto reductase [Chloroflexota bacterium]